MPYKYVVNMFPKDVFANPLFQILTNVTRIHAVIMVAARTSQQITNVDAEMVGKEKAVPLRIAIATIQPARMEAPAKIWGIHLFAVAHLIGKVREIHQKH